MYININYLNPTTPKMLPKVLFKTFKITFVVISIPYVILFTVRR